MPQINLLSPASKKKVIKAIIPGDPKAEFSLVLPVVLKRSGICLVLGLFLWVILAVNIAKKGKALHTLDQEVQVLVADPKEIEKLRNERAALEKKVKLIDELSSRKFYWYQKFELLSNILPDGVWYEEIYFKPERTVSARGSKATTEERMEFVIRGTAVASSLDDTISLIGNFVEKLERHPEFAKDFDNIDFNTSKGAIGGRDVMKFDFSCQSKSYHGD